MNKRFFLKATAALATAATMGVAQAATPMYELFSYIEKHTTAWAHRGSQGE